MRQVDLTKPLSEDDKLWLCTVNRQHDVDENQKRFAAAAQEEPPDELEQPLVEEDDYDAWKVSELRHEAESRDPVVDLTGKTRKEEIIAALRQWDSENLTV